MNHRQFYANHFRKKTGLNPIPLITLLVLILGLGACLFLSGCKPGVVEEIAEGITEGIMDQIEEAQQKRVKNNLF